MSVPLSADDDLRSRAVERIKKKRELVRNVVIFVLVNAGLWAIWALNGADTGDMWPAIVTGIWAVFLMLDLFRLLERPITDQQILDEIERLRHG